jgi:hypothetical protein
MQDYLSHLPPEILEQILQPLDGMDLSKLKQISRKFKNMLENPIAWRKIFNDRFSKMNIGVEYMEEDKINWGDEVRRLSLFQKNFKLPKRYVMAAEIPTRASSIRVHKKHVIVDGYEPLEISTCVKKGNVAWAEKYKGFLMIGQYAGRIQADSSGCHQIYNLLDEEIPVVYKRLYESTKSTLVAFSKNLAVLDHPTYITIWNLSTRCKHTEEIIWRKSKKNANCSECACICKIDKSPDNDYLQDVHCSQIDPSKVLIFSRDYLRVMRPIKGKTFDIKFDDTCQIQVRFDTGRNANQYETLAILFMGEQKITIDDKLHHIVHIVCDNRHQFYDLTAKKFLSFFPRWNLAKWIPNTSYLAMTKEDCNSAIVIDFKDRRIISQFKIQQNHHDDKKAYLLSYATGLEASKYGPVLLVGLSCGGLHLYSALTGARVVLLERIFYYQKMVLSTDEKTLILMYGQCIRMWDLKNVLLQFK